MDPQTIRTSTIFATVGEKTKVYRSVDDLPRPLRKKLEASTRGMNAATILIADRRGRTELVRALRGMPSGLQSKLVGSRVDRRVAGERGRIWTPRHTAAVVASAILSIAACLAWYLR